MLDSLPDLAQRVTVFGSTRNSEATSEGVSRDSGEEYGRDDMALLYSAEHDAERVVYAFGSAPLPSSLNQGFFSECLVPTHDHDRRRRKVRTARR
jgi:hypothetical protein